MGYRGITRSASLQVERVVRENKQEESSAQMHLGLKLTLTVALIYLCRKGLLTVTSHVVTTVFYQTGVTGQSALQIVSASLVRRREHEGLPLMARLVLIALPILQKPAIVQQTHPVPRRCITFEVSSWGACFQPVTNDGGSGDSNRSNLTTQLPPVVCTGEGVQNRTAVCMKDNTVIMSSECPIEFQSLETRSCNMSCASDCLFSEWMNFSPCSATCGEGYRTRSRLLTPIS